MILLKYVKLYDREDGGQLYYQPVNPFVVCLTFILPEEYTADWPGLDILPAAFFMVTPGILGLRNMREKTAERVSPLAPARWSGDNPIKPCKSKNTQM